MDEPLSATTMAIGITAVTTAAIYVYKRTTRPASLPYPPGPPGHFLIGSEFSTPPTLFKTLISYHQDLLDMPLTSPWHVWKEWGDKYGPITHLTIGGKQIMVINSPKAAIDLLEKRASIYSDRPRFVMCGELTGEVTRRVSPDSALGAELTLVGFHRV